MQVMQHVCGKFNILSLESKCLQIKNISCNRLAREKKPPHIRSCALLRVSHVVAEANKSRLYSQAGNTRHKHVTNYGGVKLGESDMPINSGI